MADDNVQDHDGAEPNPGRGPVPRRKDQAQDRTDASPTEWGFNTPDDKSYDLEAASTLPMEAPNIMY